MRKIYKIVIGLCCIYFSSPLTAQERIVDNVKDVVCSFFTSDSIIMSRSSSLESYRSRIQITDIKRNNTTYLYAVNMPEQGWAIVSNEQRYPEIIGYSTDSHFDTNLDKQPDALKLLLEFHMNMIDSLRESPTIFFNRESSLSPFSRPLPEQQRDLDFTLLKRDGIENYWNQEDNNGLMPFDCNKVYNKFCPTCFDVSCGYTLTGCTAVAIAQVLWYWRWPDYTLLKDNIYCSGITYGNTRRHYYDWDNMPPYITNSTSTYQVDGIAELLLDCGIAANMVYTSICSSADVILLAQALDAFHMHWIYNFNYHGTDVTSLLINEIQAQRPVICQAEKEGTFKIHTFVIDGYDPSTEMFHVNFGHGGDGNGMWDIDFNGYTVARSFFTELYPICSVREASVTSIDVDTIENGKDVTLYSANNVSLSQLTVENGGHLNVSVGGTITLGSGFKAQLGSAVKLAPNYNCSTGTSVTPASISKRKDIDKIDSTKNTNFSVSPNPAISKINIQCEEPINTISLFNINGQEVLQTKQMQIDISHLPNGIYIIRAITKDGEILQKKLIHE